jgi:predicted site-specific integrase-resolvase
MHELMTVEEVARLFHIEPRTVARWVRRHLLPMPVKGTKKPMLFDRDKILRVIIGDKDTAPAKRTRSLEPPEI